MKFEADLKEMKASLEKQQAVHDNLIEAKAKLEIKLDIQKAGNEDLEVGDSFFNLHKGRVDVPIVLFCSGIAKKGGGF